MEKTEFFKSRKFAIIAIIMGVISIALIVVLAILNNESPRVFEDAAYDFSPFNILSFFTYIAALIIAVWLITIGIAILLKKDNVYNFLTRPVIFGAMVSYALFMTASFYGVFFWFIGPFKGDLWWANIIDVWMHLVIPIFMFIIFVYSKSDQIIKKDEPILWLAFPALYMLLTFIRGAIIGWYPYPFFYPYWDAITESGIAPYVVIPLCIIACTISLLFWGYLLREINNRRRINPRKK